MDKNLQRGRGSKKKISEIIKLLGFSKTIF
jgi:hypothetical protein